MLKILEEGGEKLVFFLLTTDDNLLLPTIKSRCQTFNFSPTIKSDIINLLIKNGQTKEQATELSEICLGRPGIAIRLLEDPELINYYQNEKSRWQKMMQLNLNRKLKECKDLFSGKSVDKEKLSKVLADWQVIWRKALLNMINTNRDTKSKQKTIELINFLAKAKIMLRQNINPNLVLEEILLKVN